MEFRAQARYMRVSPHRAPGDRAGRETQERPGAGHGGRRRRTEGSSAQGPGEEEGCRPEGGRKQEEGRGKEIVASRESPVASKGDCDESAKAGDRRAKTDGRF